MWVLVIKRLASIHWSAVLLKGLADYCLSPALWCPLRTWQWCWRGFVVLRFIQEADFEHVSLKTVLLLALASAKSVSDIHSL